MTPHKKTQQAQQSDPKPTSSGPTSQARASSTIRTLIRVGKALREPPTEDAAPSGLRETARRAAETLRRDPRVQQAAGKVTELRGKAGERADQRLAELITENRAKRGAAPPQEITALLEQRRQERDEKLAKTRARQALLAQADTTEQRRVLHLIAEATPWAGGEARTVRYTQVLDALAPGGNAVIEMAVHRALWTLAERRVLAVSPHGIVTATRTIGEAQAALPRAAEAPPKGSAGEV